VRKLPELETWVRSFSYWDVLRLMDLSWQRGGLLRGERVFNQFRQVMPLEDFTDCQMPFGAVATNLSTGRELWLTEGDIHLAVRASCSMPGSWRLSHTTVTGLSMVASLTRFPSL
jgi:NTE family protein